MAILTDNPVTPAGVTYDKVAFQKIEIRWGSLNAPVKATIIGRLYGTSDGVNIPSPIKAATSIDDLYALATQRATDGKPALATALQAVLIAAEEIVRERGLLGMEASSGE